jgi:hypothetical protein
MTAMHDLPNHSSLPTAVERTLYIPECLEEKSELSGQCSLRFWQGCKFAKTRETLEHTAPHVSFVAIHAVHGLLLPAEANLLTPFRHICVSLRRRPPPRPCAPRSFMMPSATDWRSVTSYQYLTRLDRLGFAWEFLRRNAAYQDDYNRLTREDSSNADSEARPTDGLGRRWGLSFRGRSAVHRRRGDHILAPGCSAHGHSAGSNEHRGRSPARNRRASRPNCRTCRCRWTLCRYSSGERRSASFDDWAGRPAVGCCPAS